MWKSNFLTREFLQNSSFESYGFICLLQVTVLLTASGDISSYFNTLFVG